MNYLIKAGVESFVGNLAGNRITKYACMKPRTLSCLTEFNKNDYIFPSLLPIILSLVFKPLRSVTGFHGGLAFVIACISTYRNNRNLEPKDDDTKNNKPKDDDKPSNKQSEPPAITQLSEAYKKQLFDDFKEPDSGRLSPVSKMQYEYLKDQEKTTTSLNTLLDVKYKLNELAKKEERKSSQDTQPLTVGEAVERELAKRNKNNKVKNKGNKKVSFSEQIATVRTFQVSQGNKLRPLKKRK